MSNSVGRVDLDLGLNYKQFNSELNAIAGNATNMVGGAFKKLGGIIAAAFAVHELIGFGKEAIQLASDLAEVQNVVDVTFGAMAEHVNNFSKSALTSFGLSELSAKKYASTMGAMLKSSGLAGASVVKLSEDMTGLAADFASFYNLKQDDAFDKIRSGISGETEPLKQLGINLNVANLEAFALTQGIKKQYSAMSQAEQVLLRYNYLMKVSKDAQGDFARTSNGWANQTRLLSEQWKIFQGTMGQGFIAILAPVVSGLNQLISKLQIGAQYFNAFVSLITGVKQTASTAAAATTALGASAGDMGSDVKKAGKAVKGSLSSFDQLNVISQQTSDAMDGIADSASGVGAGVDLGTTPTNAKMVMPEIDMGWMKDLTKGFTLQPIIDSFNNLKTALAPFTETLFAGLKWLWDNVLLPLGQWTVNALIPAFFDDLAGIFTILNPLLLSFQPLGTWLWDNFLKPLAEFTGGVIISVLKELAEKLKVVGDWMSENQGIVAVFTETVVGFFAAWKVIQLMAFIQMSGGLVEAFNAITKAIWAATGAKVVNAGETVYLTWLYAVDFVAAIAASVRQLWYQVGAWVAVTGAMVANKIEMILATAAQWLATAAMVAYNIAVDLAAAGTWLLDAALAVLLSPIFLIVAAIALLVLGVYELIKHWEDVKRVSGETWAYIVQVWNTAASWMSTTVITPMQESFGVFWDSVQEAASSVWEGMKSVWSVAYDWLNSNVIKPIANLYLGLFNGIIDGVNWVIRALNKIHFEIPDWVPGIGGKSFGIHLPEVSKIPALANGGLVGAPTLAMVGDNKNAAVDPEVVTPLSKLQGMLDTGNQGVIAALMMVIDAIENINMSMDIDGDKLTRVVRDRLRTENSRVGGNVVTVGGVPIR